VTPTLIVGANSGGRLKIMPIDKKNISRFFIVFAGIIGCLSVRGCQTVMEKHVLTGEASYSFSNLQIYIGMLIAGITGAFFASKAVKRLAEADSGHVIKGIFVGLQYGAFVGIITGIIIGIIGWINSGNLFNTDSGATFLACTMVGFFAGLLFGLIVGLVAGFLFGIAFYFLLKMPGMQY
jgi:hypothetical protein